VSGEDEAWARRVRELEAEAGRLEAEADECRWQAARLIHEQHQAGDSDRRIAVAIGRSHTHVQKMRRAWERWGGNRSCQRFADAYRDALRPEEDPVVDPGPPLDHCPTCGQAVPPWAA
jgi:hypothetical protein